MKYAILPQHLRSEELVGGNALIEAGTFIAILLGTLLGRYYFERRFGEARWRVYTPILLAGYSCGMGLVGMSSIAVALISKAVSSIVF